MSEENQTPETEQQAAEPVENQASTAEELGLLLEDARNKVDEHWNQVLRLQAELENTRRRAERDVEAAHKFALERFVNELLPVKDSLELGLAAGSGGDEAVAKLREGMELTLKMLGAAIGKFGVEEVSPAGQPFNPELHQAMSMQHSDTPANHVMVVMQKGYTLNKRLVRPALVMVSKGPAGEPGATIDATA